MNSVPSNNEPAKTSMKTIIEAFLEKWADTIKYPVIVVVPSWERRDQWLEVSSNKADNFTAEFITTDRLKFVRHKLQLFKTIVFDSPKGIDPKEYVLPTQQMILVS